MTRKGRIAAYSALGVISVLALTVALTVVTLRSGWFSEKVRERIVAEAEKATNGRVEIGAFRFDWRTLTAEVDQLVIHGTEPAGQAPLLAAKRIAIGLKIISLTERTFNIASVQAGSPRIHLILQANGDTNIPPPHTITAEQIVNLKIGKFDVAEGAILMETPGREPKAIPWNAHGENLAAHANYSAVGTRYEGTIAMSPVHVEWDDLGAVDASIDAHAALEKSRFTISSATLKTSGSSAELRDVVLNDFSAPVVTAKYTAKVGLGEVDRVFKFVNFQHSGTVTVTGDARFASIGDFLVSGSFRGSDLVYGKVHDIGAAGHFTAVPAKVLLTEVRIDALGGDVVAGGEVHDLRDVRLHGKFERFDANTLATLADVGAFPYDGLLSGPFDASGTLSERNLHDIVGDATVAVDPAPGHTPVHGDLDVKYDSARDSIALGPSWLQLPHSRADFSGAPGQLTVKLESSDLGELKPVIAVPEAVHPGGPSFHLAFEGTLAGPLNDPRIAGHGAIQNFVLQDQKVDSATGDFTASNSGVTVINGTLASGAVQARGSGSLGLTRWKMLDGSPVNANVQIANGAVSAILALSPVRDFPLTGSLNTTAQITGTVGSPHATADLTLTKGQIYGEPYDSIAGHAQYLNGAQLFTGTASAGAKRLNLSGRLESRKLTFDVSSNAMPFDQIVAFHKRQPDIRGSAGIKADGSVEISPDLKGVKVLALNADVTATGLALGSRTFGDAHFIADTKNGILTGKLTSNAASASILGEGTMSLAGDYPVNGRVTFSNVKLNALQALLSPSAPEPEENFDGAVAGQVMVSGPAAKPDLITASLDVSQFEVRPMKLTVPAANAQKLVLRNKGPLRMTLARSVINVESARFEGPDTDLEMLGRIALNNPQSPFDLRIQGDSGLTLVQLLNADYTATGRVAIRGDIRGDWSHPVLDGSAELHNGDFRYAGFANGLTNVNAVLLFNGANSTRINIQTFTGESGGGHVDATGFATLTAGVPAFRLEAKARAVRVRYPEGVSSVSDADLTLAGTSERSEVSGSVIIRRLAINPKSDTANILASSAQPLQTSSRSGLAANMNLDVQIETAPDIAFETSVAQSVQADANLRLRGTVTNPALLGRINITQGELVFFGNKYTLNYGSVSFFNPAKIDPVINISLETRARGVDVILTVSGPIEKLNVSYRSDPPLQFGDIVALLATGRTPDTAALLSTTTAGTGAFQQLGASALLDQALSNPGSAGRLQRFFGVSNIKVDPQLSGITGSPEARLTIEQQIAPQILFTYVSDVSSTSTQLIRVEWDFNSRWGAILTREENGYVGLDFAWKKRFK